MHRKYSVFQLWKDDLLSLKFQFDTVLKSFQEKREENYKTLIRGSILDPDNHPSKDV